MKILKLLKSLFDGKREIDAKKTTNQPKVDIQRKKLDTELMGIHQSIHVIESEARKMKRQVDTAVRIAQATGGLR